MFIVLGTNTFGVGDKHIEKAHSKFTHTHTASYQCLSSRTYFEMIATHLQKRAIVITFTYSPLSVLHPQVMYAIAFSAGLNSLQVD